MLNTKLCKLFGCKQKSYAKGYCSSHYDQFRNGRKVGEVKKYKTHCSIENCSLKHHAKGYCRKHYVQINKHGKTLPERVKVCVVDGCEEKHHARGFCRKHYKQIGKLDKLGFFFSLRYHLV